MEKNRQSVFEPGGITANDGEAISTYNTDKEDHVLQTDRHVLVQTPNHCEEQGHIDDSMFYGEIKGKLIAVQQSPEESEDAVSTYSSDVPLLEPSRTPDEPLAESRDCVAENLLVCDNVNQTIQEKLYDHDTEDVDDNFTNQVVTMDTIHSYNQRLSLDIEPNSFEPNSNQVTPKSPRKMLPYFGKHEPLYVNDIDYVEVYEVTSTPLPVIGACWEFGSLSSVYNSHRELPAIRSRTSTLDQRSYSGSRRDIYGGSNRLLARVLSNAIGSIELGKGDIREPSLILLPTNESLVDVDYQTDKRLCCDNNMKNLLVVSTAVTLMFIPMFGLTNLQSSMNSEGGIGVYSIAMSFVAFLLGSLFSPVVVKRYKPKPCLVFGCLAPLFYVLVNFHPTFAFFLPASFILGLSKVILWNAVSTYISEIGVEESDRKGKPADNVISKYYGIFFLLLQLAFVFGNLISSLVLVPQPMKNHGIGLTFNGTNDTFDTDILYNISMTDIEVSTPHINTTSVCGSGYCNNIATIGSQNDIDDVRKTILLGLYSLCIIASTVIMIIFLDPLPNYAVTLIEIKSVYFQARNTFTMLFDGQFLLLLVMCMYTIVCNGFVVADILKAFVTCPLGIHMVGYSMICFGLTGAVSSYASGKLIKHTGRIVIYVTAMVTNVGCLIWMMAWSPTSEDTQQIMVLLGLWGFAEGIWQSQINSLISSVFADRYEEAFGCCRLAQGVAGILVFTLSENLCMMAKIIITMVTCVVGVAMYIVMEIMKKLCPRQKEVQNIEITAN